MAGQAACIVIGLKAPVVLTDAGTAASLVVGGATAPAELELNGATLTLDSSSQVAATGTVLIDGRNSTLVVGRGAALVNQGTVEVAYQGLQLEGDLTNAPGGTMDFLGSQGWQEPGNSGSLDLVGASVFKNEGDVWLSESGSIQAPYGSAPGAVIDNAGGTIYNGGNIRVSAGATFIEGNGNVVGSDTGNYYVVQVDGGSLVLAGDGASTFQVAARPGYPGLVAPDECWPLFPRPT